jgi:DNA-binding transcriptional ArsR family regulator
MQKKSPPILPIFRSRSVALILAYLFNRDERADPVSVSELARRVDVAPSTAQRDISALEEAGIVTSEYLGNTRLIQINPHSPYEGDLRSLFTKAFGPARILAELLALPGVVEAAIFGSWAARYHGEPGVQPGDIDVAIAVDGTASTDAIYDACTRASSRLGREVNPTILSEEEWQHGGSGFLRTIRRRPLVPLDLQAG